MEFVGPFPKLGHRIGEKYIIISIEYETKWVEAKPIEYCTNDVATKFIYENIIAIFGCPITLISDRENHLLTRP